MRNGMPGWGWPRGKKNTGGKKAEVREPSVTWGLLGFLLGRVQKGSQGEEKGEASLIRGDIDAPLCHHDIRPRASPIDWGEGKAAG